MQFDPGQTAAIESLANTVVSAGAGSGKTTVLAERYLRLVRELKTPVSAILTLTFTRKAAAEMHERIYRRLRAISDDGFVAEQLEQFDRAPISTLDSFCSQLVRSSAPQFGVTPEFRTDEDEHRTLAEAVAFDVLLDHLGTEAVTRFVTANDFEPVWKQCLVAIAEEYCLITRPLDADRIAAVQHDTLISALETALDALTSVFAMVLSLPAGSKKTLLLAAVLLEDIDLERYRGAAELPALRQKLATLQALRKPGGRSSDPDLLALKEHIDTIRTLADKLDSLAASLLMHDEVKALLRLVADFDTRLQAAKRARGLLTYADVMEMAITTLQQDKALREYYNLRFRFIMIDEFQDNNQRQKLLLYLLALNDRVRSGDVDLTDPGVADLDPHKLFFVGDDKQSIYRFRGADVSVFRKLAGELSTVDPGGPIELAHNYRSEPGLIHFFNRVFPAVMAGADQPFEARFSPLREGVAHRVEPTVRVLFKPYEESAGAEEELELMRNEDVEAYWIAHWIDRAVTSGSLPVTDGDDVRPAVYDDIALLLRSSGNQARFEHMFRRFGIPYQSQVVRSLFMEAPSYDIYQLLQLACYPEDRQAYAALLRSPLVHLDDDALLEVLLRCEHPFAPVGELSPEQAERLQAGALLYADIVALVDRVPVSQLVSRIWYQWGYRYSLLRRSGYHPYLEYYEHLFAFARRYDDAPTVDFLDALRTNLGQYGRFPDFEVISEHGQGVQIMTIHKSKGLEFPIVILANSGNAGRAEGTGSAPYYLSETHGLTFNMPDLESPSGRRAVNWFFTQGKAEEELKALAEAKRLLYVALTRAQCHLMVSGFFHRNNRNRPVVHLRMLLDALEIPIDGTETDLSAKAAAGSALDGRPHPNVQLEVMPSVAIGELESRRQRGIRVDGAAAAERYRTLPVLNRAVARREYSATELNALQRVAQDGAGRELSPIAADTVIAEFDLEQQFGTLCHAAIEHRLRSGREADAAVLERRLSELLPADTPAAARAVLLEDALLLARRFFDSPQYAGLVAPVERQRYAVEHPFLLRPQSAGRVIVHGQIDLFVPRASGGVLVDFKTSRQLFPGEYAVQLALYREAAQELFGTPVGAWVCYLRQPQWVDYSATPAVDIAALLAAAGIDAAQ